MPLGQGRWLVRNLERLIEELCFHEVRPATPSFMIAYHDADATLLRVPLTLPSDRFDLLLDTARTGLRACWRRGTIATHMHVIASDLWSGPQQLSLFDPPDP